MDAFGRHTLFVPHLRHLIRITHLDGYFLSCRCIHVNGGCGRAHIEGDFVVLCQDCHSAGSDFISRVSILSYTVTAHENNIYFSGLHQYGRHVVTLQGCCDSCVIQFKGCKAGALQQRPCLITVNMHGSSRPPLLKGNVHGRRGSAVLCSGQRTCIAVGHDANLLPLLLKFFQQPKTNPANPAADLDILLTDSVRFLEKKRFNLSHIPILIIGHGSLHAVQRPEQVDRSWPGGSQIVL